MLLSKNAIEPTTLEWVKVGLDKQTIDTKNTNQTRGRNGSSSTSYGSQGRDLMTISELSRMPDNKCILFVRGLDPFYSDKYILESHPNYKLLYEANEDNYFDSSMGWKKSSASDPIAELLNMRVPDKELEERMEDLTVVNVDELDNLEKQMDELI